MRRYDIKAIDLVIGALFTIVVTPVVAIRVICKLYDYHIKEKTK